MGVEWEPVRIPKQLFIEISEIIKKTGFWINEHEFIRDAIREKLSKCTTLTIAEKEKEVSVSG